MFEKITTTFAGRNVGSASPVPLVSETHRRWMERLLQESPASLQAVLLGQVSGGDVAMEWQAVFQGAGVAYIRYHGAIVAAGLLLEGRFLTSEYAAIEAVQQTLAAGRGKSGGFDLLRQQQVRPLRAILVLEDDVNDELLLCIQYWIDCLAGVYFRSLPATASEPRPEISSGDYSTSVP